MLEARRLPLQNRIMAVLVVAAVFALAGLLAEAPAPGPRPRPAAFLLGPLLGVVVVLGARALTRLLLRPWRARPNPGVRTLLLAAAIALTLDWILSPLSLPPGAHWNPLLRAAAILTALVLVTPWLIDKRVR